MSAVGKFGLVDTRHRMLQAICVSSGVSRRAVHEEHEVEVDRQ